MSADEGPEKVEATYKVSATVEVAKAEIGQETPTDQSEQRQQATPPIPITQWILACAAIGALVVNIVLLVLTRQSFQTARRAWVLVDQFQMPPADTPPDAKVPGSRVAPDGGRVSVQFKNFGEGPARKGHASTRITCLPITEPCPDPGKIVPSPGSEFVLGPGHYVGADYDFLWKNGSYAREETLARFNVVKVDCLYEEVVPRTLVDKPTHKLFVSTKISYVDQFKRPHWTYSCVVWNWVQAVWDAAPNGNDFD